MARTVTASLINRVLCPLRRYSPLDHVTFDQLANELPARARGEVFVGIYRNQLGSLEGCLLITSVGLWINAVTEWIFVAYDDVERVVTPAKEDYEISDHVRVLVRGGTGVDIPVRGGRGRLRDAWMIIELLRRAMHPSRDRPE